MAFTCELSKTELSLLAYLCDQRLNALLDETSAGHMQESESLHDLSIKLALLTNKKDEDVSANVTTINDSGLPYLELMTQTLKQLDSLDIVGVITISIDEYGVDFTICSSNSLDNPYMYTIELNYLEDEPEPEIVVEGKVYSVLTYGSFLENKLEQSLKDAFR